MSPLRWKDGTFTFDENDYKEDRFWPEKATQEGESFAEASPFEFGIQEGKSYAKAIPLESKSPSPWVPSPKSRKDPINFCHIKK